MDDQISHIDKLDNALVEAVTGLPVRRYRCILGWHWYIVDAEATRDGVKHLIGAQWEKAYDESGAVVEFFGRLRPSPSRNLDVCAEFEAEIERRGLQRQYLTDLCLSLGIGPAPSPDEMFRLITAPPSARVAAMLRALGEG